MKQLHQTKNKYCPARSDINIAQKNNENIAQIITGCFQASGWPGVVSVMANWFGKVNITNKQKDIITAICIIRVGVDWSWDCGTRTQAWETSLAASLQGPLFRWPSGTFLSLLWIIWDILNIFSVESLQPCTIILSSVQLGPLIHSAWGHHCWCWISPLSGDGTQASRPWICWWGGKVNYMQILTLYVLL